MGKKESLTRVQKIQKKLKRDPDLQPQAMKKFNESRIKKAEAQIDKKLKKKYSR